MAKPLTVQERNQLVSSSRQTQSPLPMASFDEAVNGRINLEQLSQGLTVRIPFFEGREVGARYHISVSAEDDVGVGTPGMVESIDEDIVWHIPSERTELFRGQTVQISYFYFPFEPPNAPIAQYFAQDEAYRPLVDEAENGVIPVSAVAKGVNVRLRASEALSADALVSLYWVGTAADASLVRYLQVEAADVGQDIMVPIDAQHLAPNKYASVDLVYTIDNAAGKWTSPVIELQVEGDLLAPEAVHTGGTEETLFPVLLPIDESGQIPMRLSTRGMATGDVVTFIFSSAGFGVPSYAYVLRQTLIPPQIGQDLLIGVPVSYGQLGSRIRAVSVVERLSGGVVSSPVRRLERL